MNYIFPMFKYEILTSLTDTDGLYPGPDKRSVYIARLSLAICDPECSRHEPNQILVQQQQDTFSSPHWSHKGDMLQAAFTLKIFSNTDWILRI